MYLLFVFFNKLLISNEKIDLPFNPRILISQFIYIHSKNFLRCLGMDISFFLFLGTPSGGSSTSRPESRADSLTGGWVPSSSTATPTAAPSVLKCLTPFSISTSSNKRKQGSINLDTFEPTSVNSKQKLEPELKGKFSLMASKLNICWIKTSSQPY